MPLAHRIIPVLLLIALLLAFRAEAIEPDQVEHAAVSAVLGALFTVAFANSEHPVLYAFSVTMGIGLAKETYDSRRGGTGFSSADLAADAIGAGAGAGTTGLLIGPRFVGWRTKF